MYLDFEDYHPDTPRLGSAISIREGVLLSLVVHAALALFLIFVPNSLLFQPSESAEQQAAVIPDQRPLQFVEVVPLRELPAVPRLPAVESDLDRRSSTVERAPEPENLKPFSMGNTPELTMGGPTQPEVAEAAPGPEAPPAPEVAADAAATPLPESAESTLQAPPVEQPAQTALRRPSGGLGSALRNLDQYLADDVFDNQNGGQTEQNADIQFDSMGVDFGPWLRRFKNQVERNWIVPKAAASFRARTVIQFYVLRNGRIVELNVVQPAEIPALTSAALNALKLSNPTAQLPPDYPADRAFFTVTFHYNEF